MAAAASSNKSETEKLTATDSFTLYSFVDEIESRVDTLRKQASALIGEQASLLMIVDQLKSDCMKCDIPPEDCQELVANMERLKERCKAVQIQVHTVRDDGQVQSLQKVNDILRELQNRLFSNDDIPQRAIQQAHLYLNACLPEAVGSIDTRFQSLVLGCALDDQKDVRRRLQTLVHECKLCMESGSAKLGNSNTNTKTTESSNNSAENSDAAGVEAASSCHSSSSSGRQTADDSSNDSTVENHRTAQWYTTSRQDRFDDGDLSVTQEEGESIQELHVKDDNASACTHSHHSHSAGPISS